MSSVIEARSLFAVNVAGLGFDVLSLWGTDAAGVCRCPKGAACDQKPGKHPIAPNGTWQETRDPARIRTLMAAPSEPNYGMVPPPGCFAWDVDGDVPERLAALETNLGPLPVTYGHETPNGEHRFYRWPPSIDRPASGNLFGIVTRWPNADKGRGYVVGPYSAIGPAIYRPIGDPHHIAELPAAWARAAGTLDRQARPAIGDVPAGERHVNLRDAARYFRGRGFDRPAIVAAVDVVNAALPQPKTAAEVLRAIGDVEQFPVDADVPAGYEPGPLWRPFSDQDRVPPGPLVVELFAPGEFTILYGPGDVGKGTISADRTVAATRIGMRVLIVDYESHVGEWARRIWDLGGAEATALVGYVHPTPPRFDPGGLLRHFEDVRLAADDFGADIVVIDSLSASCGGDPLDPAIPWLYQAAVSRLGRTTAALAHVTKAHDMQYPYGSVMWHNAARMTWSLERVTADTLKLRNRKSNDYGKAGDSLVTPEWIDDHLREVRYTDFVASVSDRIADLLADGIARTQAEIRALLLDDNDKPLGESTIRMALARETGPGKRFTVVRLGVRSVYSLRPE